MSKWDKLLEKIGFCQRICVLMNCVKCWKVTVMKCTSRKEAAAIVPFGKRDAGRL